MLEFIKPGGTRMKASLLSICIATCNRANYIGEILESIIPQITEFLSAFLKRPS
jgi:hypothetical protein